MFCNHTMSPETCNFMPILTFVSLLSCWILGSGVVSTLAFSTHLKKSHDFWLFPHMANVRPLFKPNHAHKRSLAEQRICLIRRTKNVLYNPTNQAKPRKLETAYMSMVSIWPVPSFDFTASPQVQSRSATMADMSGEAWHNTRQAG